MSLFHDLPPRLAAVALRGIIAKGPPGGVYLTFDDGPDPATTPRVLDSLAKLNCSATFFLLGTKVQKSRELAKEILASGHTVGNHGFEHRSALLARHKSVFSDMSIAMGAFDRAGLPRPKLYRPPFGQIGATTITAAKSLSLKIVLWSLSGSDWKAKKAGRLARHIVSRVEDGDIILLHDSGRGVNSLLEALPDIVEGIRAKGLKPISLARLSL